LTENISTSSCAYQTVSAATPNLTSESSSLTSSQEPINKLPQNSSDKANDRKASVTKCTPYSEVHERNSKQNIAQVSENIKLCIEVCMYICTS